MKNNVTGNLTDIFAGDEVVGTHIGKRLRHMIETAQLVESPPFPRQLQIETTNICNHGCSFCAYTLMERPKQHMEIDLFRRLVKEAYDCGAREIGLFAGAEPLTCKSLEDYIAYCHELGYEYTYISTNGALGDTDRFKTLLNAGLSSIKFSVNGGNREVYQKVHGRDDFDKVIGNIRFVSEYRKTLNRKIYLGASFVGTPETDATFEDFKALVGPLVDETVYYEASNQSGQMSHLPLPPYRDCVLPFNKLHISKEGFLKACCNDYENLLVIEDLNTMSLRDAWNSERFQAIRKRHMNDDLEGTLCARCIRASTNDAQPLNPELMAASFAAVGKGKKT